MSTLLTSTPFLNHRAADVSQSYPGSTTWDLTSFIDLDIIAAHLPFAHLPIVGKGPVFETIAALPFQAIVGVLVLIPELDSNLVLGKSEQLLAQSVVLLFLPLLGQEVLNRCCTAEER